MKYRIKGTGLDTTDLYEIPSQGFDFYNIDLRSNNGFLLKGIPGSIVCTVWTLDNLKIALEGLLKEIEKPVINILLISTDCKMEEDDLENLRDVLESGLVESIGLSYPSTLENLIEKITKLKKLIVPSCIALNLSPIYFQYDIIEWLSKNEYLQIISFNPFGGKLSAENCIKCFSVPYLLGFSSKYSDLVFLSSGNIDRAYENLEYLNLIKDREEEDEDIYNLNISVNSLIKPFKKVIETGIKYEDLVIPFNNPDLLIHPSELLLSLNKITPSVQKSSPEIEEIKQTLLEYISASVSYTGNNLDYLSCVRPLLVKNLKEMGWEVNQAKLSEGIVMLKIKKILKEKRLLGKSKKVDISYNILLTVFGEGKIIFQEIKNAENTE